MSVAAQGIGTKIAAALAPAIVPQSSPLTRALALLRSKGGHMYLAGPANRIASDGSGSVAVTGDPIGWARNLAGDSAAIQATTAAKPKLVREPILGPELVTNGDFSNGLTGWVVVPGSPPGTIDIVAGEAVVTSQGGFTQLNNAGNRPTVLEGRQYRLTYSGRLAGASAGWVIVGRTGAGNQYGTLPITTDMRQRTLDITAAGSDIALALQVNNTIVGGRAIFDNISVREILGYTDRYYWEFDGVDDRLNCAAPGGFTAPNGNGALLCCAGTALRVGVDSFIGVANVSAGNQVFMLYSNSGFLYGVFRDSLGTGAAAAGPALTLGNTGVLTLWNDAGTLRLRRNGLQVASIAAPTGAISMGGRVAEIAGRGENSGVIGNVRVQAPVITTGITTLAEVQQIERAVAQAAGVTLP